MKYVYKTRVPFSQTGAGEGFSVIGAAQMIEDSVCAFFAAIGKDNVSLAAKYNAVWVFVKNKFQRRAIAKWNEEITVESYFTAVTKATVVVDTVIKNSKGEISVAARSEACVIDRRSFKILRVSSVDFPENVPVYASEAGFDFTRFNVENSIKIGKFTVPSTSIDACRHLNNVEYLRFILNTVPTARETLNPVFETEISYVNQAREDEEIAIFFKKDDKSEFYELKNGDKTVAKCNIKRKSSAC